ncbi:phage holin family protein [Vallitalea okinawensis]|uniref:phage holin family protein n=1 Tax=Vallitalea okinawensis TaxID=2078660 RepID=UPI000CFD5A91|nr:phage holin family protein [Vallitalea okinawensis]
MANTEGRKEVSVKNIVARLVLTAIVVCIAAFLTPGFSISGIWALILAAIVIVALDYLIQRFTGIDASPFGRGVVGFIVSGFILYATQFVVTGFEITIWGAIIGAIVIGIIDMVLPGDVM